MANGPTRPPQAGERPVNCSSCGFANTAAARYCGGCGEALESVAGAAPEAERRQVCILFCDIVGFAPFSGRADEEDERDLVGRFQRACEPVALQHDGFVAQYRGDSVEVYFGYPRAHEDDASRAVRCAFDLQKAVRDLSNAANPDLDVRIGIDSGRVVVGALQGSDPAKRAAFGMALNITARAQAEAAPGEVVVTDSVWRQLPATFTAEPMSSRKLKGIERPIDLYRMVPSGGRVARPNRPPTPFIGRARERERVQSIWERARPESPQFVFLWGEPGIGKSRMIEIIREEIGKDNADVLLARCTPVTANTALYPIIELIGMRLGLESASADERVARIERRMIELGIDPKDAVPLLASILSVPIDATIWPAPNLSSARARQRTMDIVIEAIRALTRRGPVLFIVEDLHWADASTKDLIRLLTQARQNDRLMVMLTARPEFRPTWGTAANMTEIELEPLNSVEAEAVVRKVAKDKPLPVEVAWQIREKAAGNPLFLEEITRSIVESGALVERERVWEVVGAAPSEAAPVSMEASLMARIDRLGDARPMFQLAATLGREFSHELLAAVAQESEDILRQRLDVMLHSGLLYEHGETARVYAFKHALVRDAAYDSLLRTTRQRYHARIAEVLLAHFPKVAQNRPELLAHHFSGAGFPAEAAVHWQAAGENAAARSAVNEAVAHLRRALAELDQLPHDLARMDRELSVLTVLAPAASAVYGWAASEVGEACRRAIELARQLGAPERMYAPLWGLWTNQFVGGQLHEAMDTAARALAMALPTSDAMLEVTARHTTSYTRFYRGEYDASIAEAEAGLRHYNYEMELTIARTFQLSSSICSMHAKASSLWMLGRQSDGIALMDEMVALARSLRHPPSLATALGQAMFFSLYDRDWTLLFAFADETYDLSQAEGFAMWTANAGMHRGRARIGLGQVERGVAEVLEWGALLRQTGSSGVLEGSVTSMVSEAMHIAGRSEEALAVSAEGERSAEAGVVRVMTPEIFRTRGDIFRDLERLNEADDAYRRAVASARTQHARSLELRALTSLLDLRFYGRQPGDIPAELRRVMDAMAREHDRPDSTSARALLARVTARTSRRKARSSP